MRQEAMERREGDRTGKGPQAGTRTQVAIKHSCDICRSAGHKAISPTLCSLFIKYVATMSCFDLSNFLCLTVPFHYEWRLSSIVSMLLMEVPLWE